MCFLLQVWKSFAVYEALASPVVSEKSLTKYSPVPIALAHVVCNAEHVQWPLYTLQFNDGPTSA